MTMGCAPVGAGVSVGDADVSAGDGLGITGADVVRVVGECVGAGIGKAVGSPGATVGVKTVDNRSSGRQTM